MEKFKAQNFWKTEKKASLQKFEDILLKVGKKKDLFSPFTYR